MTQQKRADMVARPKMLREFCALLYDALYPAYFCVFRLSASLIQIGCNVM